MQFTGHENVALLLSIGAILILSRLASEFGKQLALPLVAGELLLGILAGPTVFGYFYPRQFDSLFPIEGAGKPIMQGITQLSVIMLLFVAGLEVQLRVLIKERRAAMLISVMSIILPLVCGFLVVWYQPQIFAIRRGEILAYALFFGIAMSVSAIPVIARILMDLKLYKTELGMIIMAAATLSDMAGWVIFSLILGLIGNQVEMKDIAKQACLIVTFFILVLLLGRRVISTSLAWANTKLSWPGGVLSICIGSALIAAAFTESIGLHANLGAFIMGIAIGNSENLAPKAREIMYEFVMNILAPLFFVSIGLQLNFVHCFNPRLVIMVFSLAVVLKMASVMLGARRVGWNMRECLVVAFGLNVRGVMEIILGRLAFDAGLIDGEMFVALVVMALLTSIISAPLLKKVASTSVGHSYQDYWLRA